MPRQLKVIADEQNKKRSLFEGCRDVARAPKTQSTDTVVFFKETQVSKKKEKKRTLFSAEEKRKKNKAVFLPNRTKSEKVTWGMMSFDK